MIRRIICIPVNGSNPYVVKEFIGGGILPVICAFRSEAFNTAASGKHGDYPLDNSFNDAVEEDFSENGLSWTAKDGLELRITEE